METRNLQNTSTDFNREIVASTPYVSAVSWGAIFAGAAAAASLSLILLLLGTGLGFSAISPWSHEGISGTAFGTSTILWVTLTSLAASGVGGYIAGRLRARWVATHSDEVYFRDTAHGFLAWSVATLATAALLSSAVTAVVGSAVDVGTNVAAGAATGATATAAAAASNNTGATDVRGEVDKSLNYFIDTLFRRDLAAPPATTDAAPTPGTPGTPAPVATPNADLPQPGTAASRAEVARIYANALSTGTLPAADIRYAGQVVAQRTGLTQAEAEQRVTQTFQTLQTKLRDAENTARAAADKARKAAAYGSLWLFISLLIGAFVASFAATFGGRQRDL